MSNSAFLRFSIVPPKFFNGCLLDNFWCCIEIFGLFGGQKNVDKGIKACRHPDKGNVSSFFFDVVMLVILLHSLCTCQEQSQNVGTFLSKKSWLRVRAKKWQICVGSRLHILCYSGSIRVWASPYRLVHSEVTLTKNALKKCPCQICHKIYIFYDAKQNTKYAKKPQLCQKNTKYAKKAPNTPKYSKFSFTLFCREKNFCSKFTHFLVYFLQA